MSTAVSRITDIVIIVCGTGIGSSMTVVIVSTSNVCWILLTAQAWQDITFHVQIIQSLGSPQHVIVSVYSSIETHLSKLVSLPMYQRMLLTDM